MPPEPDSPLLRNLLLLPRMLRRSGVTVSLDQTLRFARALEWLDISNRAQVFHAARALLVTRQETLRLFETVFNSFWRLCSDGGRPLARRPPPAPRHDPQPRKTFDVATYMAYKARRFDPEIEVADRSGTASDEEVLRHKDFSEMTPEELATLRRLIREMQWRASERRTRRRISAARGDQVDLRRILRKVARTGHLPLRPPWRRRKVKPRPLVLLADVSGSMEKYSRLVLQFFFSVRHSLTDVECFTFGTRLSRITDQLAIKNVDLAIDEASREVSDWAGGTRIGECLGAFNRRWARRVLRRGAVVLIVSDGWERGDTGRLAAEIRFLHHRCHRLIWLNPLAGKRAYRPRVGGMSAALPFVDDFLPVHDLHSLEQLARHLQALPRRSAVPVHQRQSRLQ
ncbi:MAG: VWA domain-containing protein [bacterium]|nr:VWA domain-containing protein [bacterium]